MAVLHRGGGQSLIPMSWTGRAIAVVLLVLVVIAGCDDSGPLRDLRAMPEATLYYPDSKVVREIATPQINSPDGKSGAAFGHLLGANATRDEVLAFYDRELQARGWRTTAPGTGTNELKVAAWTNDKAIFRLGINLPESLTQDVRAALAGYSIEYDARVIQIYPPPT